MEMSGFESRSAESHQPTDTVDEGVVLGSEAKAVIATGSLRKAAFDAQRTIARQFLWEIPEDTRATASRDQILDLIMQISIATDVRVTYDAAKVEASAFTSNRDMTNTQALRVIADSES